MEKVLTGAAGEYYIAYKLSSLGYAIGLTPRGSRAADMLASNPQEGKSIIIQIKTMGNAFVPRKKDVSYWHWRINQNRAKPRKNFYYTFVDLKVNSGEKPDVFIIPSLRLEDYALTDRPGWFGLDVSEDNEDFIEKYRNRWDIIQKALGE